MEFVGRLFCLRVSKQLGFHRGEHLCTEPSGDGGETVACRASESVKGRDTVGFKCCHIGVVACRFGRAQCELE